MQADLPHGPLESLNRQLRAARRVVVLTGAGMSAESGIPTFRDALTGLWSRFDPYTLATPEGFDRDPATVWAWYESRRQQVMASSPHPGHLALARLAALPRFERFTVVTQNVDDLHERAGCRKVIHLHGSLFAPRCQACGTAFRFEDDAPASEPGPPRCATCGGRVRPGVVWFGEPLPQRAWADAMECASEADLMLVVGTSGQVYPAASLPDEARQRGGRVAVINPADDAHEAPGDLDWHATAGEALPALLARMAHG